MENFATQKLTNVTVCFLGYKSKDRENNEINAMEVEYCISSGFVKIVTSETIYVTHIGNVVLKTKV